MFTTDDTLNEYLKRITELAYHGDDDTLAVLARETVPRLVCAVKALLVEHRPDQYGRCPSCRENGLRQLKYPKVACPPYTTAYRVLVELPPVSFNQPQHAAD